MTACRIVEFGVVIVIAYLLVLSSDEERTFPEFASNIVHSFECDVLFVISEEVSQKKCLRFKWTVHDKSEFRDIYVICLCVLKIKISNLSQKVKKLKFKISIFEQVCTDEKMILICITDQGVDFKLKVLVYEHYSILN